MTCLGCFTIHTAAAPAIRCYEAWRAKQYLHSDPSKISEAKTRNIRRLQSGFSSRRNRGGRPKRADATTGRERTRRWRAKRTRALAALP